MKIIYTTYKLRKGPSLGYIYLTLTVLRENLTNMYIFSNTYPNSMIREYDKN